MPTLDEDLSSILKNEYLDAHGSHAFTKLNEKFKKKKSAAIISFFKGIFYQDPIAWEEIKESIWATEEEREANRFHFLQGDVIQTTLVEALSQSKSHQTNDLWIVCTPTCDIARGPDYIKVAKLFRIDVSDTLPEKDGSAEYDEFKKLSLGCKFASTKYFPLPPFLKDDPDTFGYYADLETPYFLSRSNLGAAVPKHSLKFQAWHLFNIYLMERDTRSNPKDEPHIRCHFEKIALPKLERDEIRVYHGIKPTEFRIVSKHFTNDAHEDHLKDGDHFTGKWIKVASKEVYWFMKNGLDHQAIIERFKE